MSDPPQTDPALAVALAERDVAASRGAPEAWVRLAHAHWAAGRPQSALAACDAGLAIAADAAPLLCAKADFLSDLRRSEEARDLYRRAGEDGRAAFGLARLALEAGDWAQAERQLARLGPADAAQPQAQWLKGRIALGRGDPAAARAAFETLIQGAGLAPAQRAEGLLLLAEALDGLGDPSAAFRTTVEGKAIQRRLYAGLAAGREPIGLRLLRLKGFFDRADPGAWRFAPPAPGPAQDHVFLVGFPRSGTTLLEQALAGHPAVCALEEAPTLAAAHAAFLGSDARLARLAGLSEAEADTWRARYWAEVAGHGMDVRGRVFVDKAPAATEDLPMVARLFPEARVLFAIRDPRDVVLSCLRQNFRMNAMTYAFTDLAAAAECYAANMALAETYRRVLPLPFMEVRHEALLADFEGGLRGVCGFLGLTFEAGMLDVAATAAGRTVRTPSAPQVRAGLNARGVGRWRAYERELAPVLPLLAAWVARFGYPSS